MNTAVLSINIRRLRTAAGLTQAGVASAAGLTRVGYRKIEVGETEPRVNSLLSIAKVLGVSLPQLLAPVRELRNVRFRARKKMATRADILARVACQIDDYSELEGLLGASTSFPLMAIRAKLGSRSSGEQRAMLAAEKVREAFQLGQRDVIRDICGVLEDHGVKVLTPVVASEGFFGLSVGEGEGGPAVVVNTWDRVSVERWIFTAAHELGHIVLHHDAYDVEQAEENDGQEKEADVFASHFLMPQVVFEQEWNEARGLPLLDRLFKVKRIFRVSYQSVLYRVASREEDRDRRNRWWTTTRAELESRFGRPVLRTEEPEALPREAFLGSESPAPPVRLADEPERLGVYDFVEDRLSRLVRQALEQELMTVSRGAEILDISLDDMRARCAAWD